MENKYELVVVVINNGFTDLVMEGARAAGARGGTVLHARGTTNHDNEKFFGISLQSDKEMVLIIVEKELKDAVMKEVYKKAGLSTKGQGIAFTMPVEDVVGIITSNDTVKGLED